MLKAALDRTWERPSAKDWVDVLASLPLFSRLGKRQLRQVAGVAQFKHFADGDYVVRRETPVMAST
jgi:hypothetical protein